MKKYTCGMMLLMIAAVGLVVPSTMAAPSHREKEYGTQIDELIPGMAAKSIPDREGPQQTLERMCFEASKPGNEANRAALSRALIARCGPETPEVARVWMLRKLDPMGRDEVVDGLTKLLDDEEPRMRELARRALMNNPSPRAAGALRDYLQSVQTPADKVAAINALAWRKDAQGVSLILDHLAHESDDVVTAAVVALGKIGSPGATNAVRRLLNRLEEHPRQRDEIIEAALRSAEHLLEAGRTGRAANFYVSLLEDPNQGVRIAAIHGLVEAAPDRALPKLIELFDEEDSRLQLVAIRCAQELEGEAATDRLIGALDGTSPVTKAMIIDVLGRRGDRLALKPVLGYVRDDNAQVRRAALSALKTLGNRQTVRLLAERAAATDGSERETARDSLAGLAAGGANQEIIKGIGETTGAVRAELIRAAAVRRIARAKPEIFNAADDDDPAVRGAVIAALGELGTVEDLPRLVDLLLKGITDDSRAAAEEAIVTVCRRIDDPDERTRPIIEALPDADDKTRVSLVRILGRLQGDKAVPAVRAAAASDNPAVRQAAAEVLRGWEPTYVDAWLFSGPYRQGDKGPEALFDVAFAPEKGEPVDWKPLDPKAREHRDALVFHLHKVANEENCVGYVKTTLVSMTETKVVLTFGSDDGIKVWLNGKLIHASNQVRGITPDQERVEAPLAAGENELLLKITQGGADWSFSCGIKALDGGPIDGLKIKAKP